PCHRDLHRTSPLPASPPSTPRRSVRWRPPSRRDGAQGAERRVVGLAGLAARDAHEARTVQLGAQRGVVVYEAQVVLGPGEGHPEQVHRIVDVIAMAAVPFEVTLADLGVIEIRAGGAL